MANHNVIKDDGQLFQIIPTTRRVMVPPAYLVIGTVGDHNSEQLTFKCPKVIDGHDVVHCSDHYVIWKNVLGETGRSEITDFTTDEEFMYFTWVISAGVTAAAGFISFTIHFEDSTDGAIAYKWSTTVCKDCQVLDTIQVVSGGGSSGDGSGSGSGDSSGDGSEGGDGSGTGSGTGSSENTYIPDGYVRPSGTIDITENGEYNVTGYETARVNAADNVTLHPISITENGEYKPETGFAYDKAIVDVQPPLQDKTVEYNGTVKPDSGYYGLSSVTVNVPQPTGAKAITMNGEYYIRDYEIVEVQVKEGEVELQALKVDENGTYTPDPEHDGFSSVVVDVRGSTLEEGDGISISEDGVVSVNVDGESIKLNKSGQLEGVTSVFNDSIVISTEDAVNIINSAEIVEYVDGNRLTYGSINNQLIAQGYVIYGYNTAAPNGAINASAATTSASGISDVPGYDYEFSKEVICSHSAMGNFVKAKYVIDSICSSYVTCHTLLTASDGSTAYMGPETKHYNDTGIDLSFLFFWDSIVPPGKTASDGTVLEFGGLLCYGGIRYKSDASTYVLSVDASPLYYIPFGSMAEYNAAVALTYEPTT